MYSDRGKRYKTLSASSVGTIKGYSTSFFVSENGSWIFLWNADGKKYKTLSKNMVGDIIGVAGNTFTSRNGNWIYTWTKDGKKSTPAPPAKGTFTEAVAEVSHHEHCVQDYDMWAMS